MKEKIFASILIGALVISAFSGCGNSAQESTEALAPSMDITAGTGTNEAEETARTEEDAGAKAEEEAAAKAAEEEAARQEEANTYYETGRAYLYGLDGKEFNLEAAYTNFEKALELEKAEANLYLGMLYDYWYSYPELDYEKAKNYYEAVSDDPYAQLALGLLYYYGDGVDEDTEKAQELYDTVIAEGYVEGYLGYGDIAENNEEYDAAFEFYNKVLEGNEQVYVASAMCYIGSMYFYGRIEQNYTKAFEWYQKAADLENISAMYYVGYMYENELGIEQDYSKAMDWYKKTADLGDADAMNQIGYMYFNGLGVEQDYPKAMEWFEKAADLGHSNAMHNIGYMYENGLGVEQDSNKAQEWYDKAAAAE